MSGIGGKAATPLLVCFQMSMLPRMHVMACMLQFAWHGDGACKRGQSSNRTSTAFDRPTHGSWQGLSSPGS
jgi:hypothetical protein